MNINIVSFYFGNNYGALLQCYYLRKFLKKNFSNKEVSYSRYQPKKLIFREEISPILKKNPIKIYQGFKRFIVLRKWKQKNIQIKPSYIKENINDNAISVYGSDEIWNYENPFFGYDEFYFGKYSENKKISYAASFGSASKKNLNDNLLRQIKTSLKKFSFLSVRDENSWDILKNKLGFSSEIVLDPVFLIDDHNGSKLKNNTCIIYGNYFSKKQINNILRYCKLNNLKILSVGYYNDWAKSNVTMNPFNFQEEIKNSELVITSMFHGVQFAVKYNKNFWYSADPYRVNKLSYFLKKLKLNNRKLEDNNNLKIGIDYDLIKSDLENWKKSSKDYLVSAINSFNVS